MLVQALAMTGSDLCSAAKPWDAQIQTAEIIYAEFHEQVNQSSNFTRSYARKDECPICG